MKFHHSSCLLAGHLQTFQDVWPLHEDWAACPPPNPYQNLKKNSTFSRILNKKTVFFVKDFTPNFPPKSFQRLGRTQIGRRFWVPFWSWGTRQTDRLAFPQNPLRGDGIFADKPCVQIDVRLTHVLGVFFLKDDGGIWTLRHTTSLTVTIRIIADVFFKCSVLFITSLGGWCLFPFHWHQCESIPKCHVMSHGPIPTFVTWQMTTSSGPYQLQIFTNGVNWSL